LKQNEEGVLCVEGPDPDLFSPDLLLYVNLVAKRLAYPRTTLRKVRYQYDCSHLRKIPK
jgi:hypothetical protein